MALDKTYLVIALTVAACGGSQKQDSNTTTTVERFEDSEPTLAESTAKVEQMSVLYGKLGDGVDKAGSNCDAVATAIRLWSNENGEQIKSLNGELGTLPQAHVKELAPTLEASMRRAALQVKDGSDRCPGHQGVFDAISSLPR